MFVCVCMCVCMHILFQNVLFHHQLLEYMYDQSREIHRKQYSYPVMKSLPQFDLLVKLYAKLTNITLHVTRLTKCYNMFAVTSLHRAIKYIFDGGSVVMWTGNHRDGRSALVRVNGAPNARSTGMRYCSIASFHVLTSLVVHLSMAMTGHTLYELDEMLYSKTTFMSYHGQQVRQIYLK